MARQDVIVGPLTLPRQEGISTRRVEETFFAPTLDIEVRESGPAEREHLS
jgi:hypothetical protein